MSSFIRALIWNAFVPCEIKLCLAFTSPLSTPYALPPIPLPFNSLPPNPFNLLTLATQANFLKTTAAFIKNYNVLHFFYNITITLFCDVQISTNILSRKLYNFMNKTEVTSNYSDELKIDGEIWRF